MPKYPDVKEIQVDPYGHKNLISYEAFPPDTVIFVAEATVSYDAIGATESYWLQDSHADDDKCYLWCRSDQTAEEYFCCAMIKPNKTDTTSDRAKKMLRAFLLSRAPYAVSLCEFTEEGLLTRKWLDDFINTYREALEPPRIPENGQTEIRELFYDDGNLRYRGEQSNGVPHGKGIGYWKNGNVWCDGHFKNDQPHGQCRLYFPDGTLRHIGIFSEGYPRGWGKEYFDNGQLWFEGIFGKQHIYYGWGARARVKGKLFDRDGRLLHDGRFITSGHSSVPDRQIV
jgi:hypothetical protein